MIVPSITWVACAEAIVLPAIGRSFCDVDPETCNVTPESVMQAMTPATRAIMVVHYAGLPIDLEPIIELGLPIIEDASARSRLPARQSGLRHDW